MSQFRLLSRQLLRRPRSLLAASVMTSAAGIMAADQLPSSPSSLSSPSFTTTMSALASSPVGSLLASSSSSSSLALCEGGEDRAPVSDTESATGAVRETREAEAEAETEAGTEVETKAEAEVETKVEIRVEAEVEADVETGVEAGADSQGESEGVGGEAEAQAMEGTPEEDLVPEHSQPLHQHPYLPGLTQVVGSTAKDAITYTDKPVLLKLHAQDCFHCSLLGPGYEVVAEVLEKEEGIVVAQMDITHNHDSSVVSDDEYGVTPILKFFPSSSSSSSSASANDVEKARALEKREGFELKLKHKHPEDILKALHTRCEGAFDLNKALKKVPVLMRKRSTIERVHKALEKQTSTDIYSQLLFNEPCGQSMRGLFKNMFLERYTSKSSDQPIFDALYEARNQCRREKQRERERYYKAIQRVSGREIEKIEETKAAAREQARAMKEEREREGEGEGKK